jgi:hypothetical protein
MGIVNIIVTTIRALLIGRSSLIMENLALRQQHAVLQLSGKASAKIIIPPRMR